MRPPAPPELLERAGRWDRLSRWERSELGRTLRRLGWTYSEIMGVIPVPKATLAGWCSQVRLTQQQIEEIKRRVPSQLGIPKDSQWRRRLEIGRIEAQARLDGLTRLEDPFWVAGTCIYWAEGSKAKRSFELANSDPRVLALFIAWVRRYHDPGAQFVLGLHLHEGNDEAAAQSFWCLALDLPGVPFYKSFIKPRGTGHRKNHLPHGVCRIRVRKSTNAWLATMVWIDVVADQLSLRGSCRPGAVTLLTGR